MPSHPVALELIRRAGVPLAAPSANLFGHVSPTTARHVLDDLDGRIDAVLDAGPTPHGVESTVLDPMQSPMTIYRPGAVTAEQIRAAVGPVEFYRKRVGLSEPADTRTFAESLPSPGVGLRHYSPRARLVLVEGTFTELRARLAEAAHARAGQRLGVLLPDELPVPEELASAPIFAWGSWSSPEEMARRLYAGLRTLDAQRCEVILCPVPAGDGIGAALRDRLFKAAHNERQDPQLPED